MKNFFQIILLFLIYSCNESIDTASKSKSKEDSFSFISIGKTDLISIFDTLIKYENKELVYLYFSNNAILDDYYFQGKVNNTNFGIHCKLDPDNYLNLYVKSKSQWRLIDSIPQFGSNYKEVVFKDLNTDNYFDLLLFEHDLYHRIVFLYEPKEGTLIHTKGFDILELKGHNTITGSTTR